MYSPQSVPILYKMKVVNAIVQQGRSFTMRIRRLWRECSWSFALLGSTASKQNHFAMHNNTTCVCKAFRSSGGSSESSSFSHYVTSFWYRACLTTDELLPTKLTLVKYTSAFIYSQETARGRRAITQHRRIHEIGVLLRRSFSASCLQARKLAAVLVKGH